MNEKTISLNNNFDGNKYISSFFFLNFELFHLTALHLPNLYKNQKYISWNNMKSFVQMSLLGKQNEILFIWN